MTYYVKINGNPTVTLRDEHTALHSYQRAVHWRLDGHSVELFFGTRNITPTPMRLGK